jgi:kynurenine formamidase
MDSIAAFASINYRLSPYPSHSTKPSSPDDPSRNVHYPSHLLDVAHALLYLEKQYRIGDRFLLVGHSAGATMAFELHNWYMPHSPLPTPAGVLGVAGIYHFEAFIQAHSKIPMYREIMENAIPDTKLWERASPYRNRLPGHAKWEQAKAVIISHSSQDELVEKAQPSYMLERVRLTPHFREKAHFLEASGSHDEIWQSGDILAGLIIKSLQILQSASRQEDTRSNLEP